MYARTCILNELERFVPHGRTVFFLAGALARGAPNESGGGPATSPPAEHSQNKQFAPRSRGACCMNF